MKTKVWNYRMVGVSETLKKHLTLSKLMGVEQSRAKQVYKLLSKADELLGQYGKQSN